MGLFSMDEWTRENIEKERESEPLYTEKDVQKCLNFFLNYMSAQDKEIERQREQLAIAIEALQKYAAIPDVHLYRLDGEELLHPVNEIATESLKQIGAGE